MVYLIYYIPYVVFAFFLCVRVVSSDCTRRRMNFNSIAAGLGARAHFVFFFFAAFTRHASGLTVTEIATGGFLEFNLMRMPALALFPVAARRNQKSAPIARLTSSKLLQT